MRMPDNENALAKKFKFGQKTGLAAQIERADKHQPQELELNKFKNRIVIFFDDSSSMSGGYNWREEKSNNKGPIDQAKEAIDGFLKSCNVNDTAIGITPLNAPAMKMTPKYSMIAMAKDSIMATGGTPLYEKFEETLKEEPLINRGIAFSDGAPNSCYRKGQILTDYKVRKIPIDTVFIGDENDSQAIAEMKMIAEETGGIFIHFKPGVSFATNFKYLAPGYRAMLMDSSFKDKIEKGSV